MRSSKALTSFWNMSFRRCPSMPIARIYASQVEEAEPICADLLARGYDVEVVFPDAVLSNPADLELRVERCSAEEAVARVEAAGSSSRCVFMTPGKGPRRELLLVEMTVLATGTEGRHPISMPRTSVPMASLAMTSMPMTVAVPMPVANPELRVENMASLPGPETVPLALPSLAEVLPFPVSVPEVGETTPVKSEPAWPVTEGDASLSRHLIFELNAFLAHAPTVERPDGLYIKWFESVRQTVTVERARKNWEGLTLVGVAASLVLLMLLGWYAGPAPSGDRLRVSEAQADSRLASGTTLPEGGLRSVVLKAPRSNAARDFAAGQARSIRRESTAASRVQDDRIAPDQVIKVVRRTVSKGWSSQPGQLATTSELVQPAAIQLAPKSAPIKIITDLK